MPVYKKKDINKLLKDVEQGKQSQIYLIFGERFLCRQAAGQVTSALIPAADARANSLTIIDGDQEEPLRTLALLKSYSLFAGRQIYQVNESKLFHSKFVAKGIWIKAQKAWQDKNPELACQYLRQLAGLAQISADALPEIQEAKWRQLFGFPHPHGALTWIAEASDILSQDTGDRPNEASQSSVTEQYEKAIAAGIPPDNILILLAETVDKRKRFYKFIQKYGVVVDLAVEPGSTKGAKSSQEAVLKELVLQTLAEFGKKIEPRALAALIERVGFHPVAIVRETEKLALYVGQAVNITVNDLQAIVGRTREDALFELAEAVADFDLEQSLLLAARLIENGVHPLVLVAGLRNHFKKLLLVRSFIESPRPAFIDGMTYSVFQKGYLPDLKAARENWLPDLPNHPYALFMMFVKAQKIAMLELVRWMRELLIAELSLKSSGQPPLLIFERFLFKSLADKKMGDSPAYYDNNG